VFYIFIFILAILFAYLAQANEKNNLHLFFSALACLTLILPAGFRDLTVGTDSSLYPVTVFENGKEYEFSIMAMIEPLYGYLGFIVRKFNGSLWHLYLITHLIIIFSFYLSFWRLRRQISIAFAMFLFCFIWYNISLNISRQSIAIGLVLLGYTYLIKKRLKIFVTIVCIAILFHKSAIVAFLMIPLLYMKNLKINYTIFFLLLLVLLLYGWLLSRIPIVQGLEKYEQYQSGEGYEGKLSFSETILRLSFLYIVWKFRPISKRRWRAYMIFFLCELLLNLFQVWSRFVGRIGLCFFVVYFLYIPQCLHLRYKSFDYKRTMLLVAYYLSNLKFLFLRLNTIEYERTKLFLLLLVLFYWLYVIVYSDAGCTMPYTSRILGF